MAERRRLTKRDLDRIVKGPRPVRPRRRSRRKRGSVRASSGRSWSGAGSGSLDRTSSRWSKHGWRDGWRRDRPDADRDGTPSALSVHRPEVDDPPVVAHRQDPVLTDGIDRRSGKLLDICELVDN